MTIFQDSEGMYISMENYIKTMLVKLGMEGATGLSVRTPIHKPIEDMRDISDVQVAFFLCWTSCILPDVPFLLVLLRPGDGVALV